MNISEYVFQTDLLPPLDPNVSPAEFDQVVRKYFDRDLKEGIGGKDLKRIRAAYLSDAHVRDELFAEFQYLSGSD